MRRNRGIGAGFSEIELGPALDREDPSIIIWKNLDSVIEAEGEWEAEWEDDPVDPIDPFGGGNDNPTDPTPSGGGAVGTTSNRGGSSASRSRSSPGRLRRPRPNRKPNDKVATRVVNKLRKLLRKLGENRDKIREILKRIEKKLNIKFEEYGIGKFDSDFLNWLFQQIRWYDDLGDLIEEFLENENNIPEALFEGLLQAFFAEKMKNEGKSSSVNFDKVIQDFLDALERLQEADKERKRRYEDFLKQLKLIGRDAVRSKYEFYDHPRKLKLGN